MTKIPHETRVDDESVPKVNDEIAVGEDIEFQRKWWRFEKIIWPILFLIIVVDMLGGFGRGWLANTRRTTPDDALSFDYERIERTNTPSTMRLRFGPAAVRNGQIKVFVSDSILEPLGAQRVSPQPAVSTIGNGGITYTFPSAASPARAEIQLQPSFPGVHAFRVQVEGSTPIQGTVTVLP